MKLWGEMADSMDWTLIVGHSVSGGAIVSSLLGMFPPIAAGIAILFYLVQIYESATVQTWFHTRRIRKIAALKKQMAKLEAQEMKSVRRLHRKTHDSDSNG